MWSCWIHGSTNASVTVYSAKAAGRKLCGMKCLSDWVIVVELCWCSGPHLGWSQYNVVWYDLCLTYLVYCWCSSCRVGTWPERNAIVFFTLPQDSFRTNHAHDAYASDDVSRMWPFILMNVVTCLVVYITMLTWQWLFRLLKFVARVESASGLNFETYFCSCCFGASVFVVEYLSSVAGSVVT